MEILETKEQWNALIDEIKASNIRVLRQGKGTGKFKEKTTNAKVCWIDETDTKATLVWKKCGCANATNYTFFLSGEPKYEEAVVANAARELSRHYKAPKFTEKQCLFIGSASPIIGYNEKYSGTRQEAWEYDLRSAYSWAMLQPIPDTDKPLGSKQLEEGEIGFNKIDGKSYACFEVGTYCTFVFPAMESPYKEYVKKYFDLKEKARDKKEKSKYKGYLNVVIGNFQNSNPFIRSCIVTRANNRIKNLIDEDTLMWNTDSIISRVRREDIEKDIGAGIGQWQIKHHGQLAYIGNTYQWDSEIPSWRGIPKAWFPQQFDLLKDQVPKRFNPYIFDWETGYIKENEAYGL